MVYIGKRMSERASLAHNNGEKPISLINTKDKEKALTFLKENNYIESDFEMKVWQFKEFLLEHGKSSWHHTGEFFNETNFYSFSYAISNGFENDIDYLDVKNVVLNVVETFKAFSTKTRESDNNKKKNTKINGDYYFAEVSYEEWGGTRKRPELAVYKDHALIYGSFAYLLKRYKKKNISGKHFYIKKCYGKRKPKHFDKRKVAKLRKELKL